MRDPKILKSTLEKSDMEQEKNKVLKKFLVCHDDYPDVLIARETTDSIALRVSIGGEKLKGYYFVFRGDNLDEIEDMINTTLKVFQKVKKQLQVNNQNDNQNPDFPGMAEKSH